MSVVGSGDLDTLLENITQFTCELNSSVTGHISNFDEEDTAITPGTISHQPCHNARTASLFGNLFFKLFNTQNVLDVLYTQLRITMDACVANLVDFIEQDHGVSNANLPQPLNDEAWHGRDVGSSMAPNLSLITNTTKGDAMKLAAKSRGD
ncbi:hypothetical protein HG531_010418 [Fusarium graminearum]|nr:hypothetical protein HG531_010418 [Fusarium graminearum]